MNDVAEVLPDPPADVLTPFLGGTDIDTPAASQRLREQLRDVQRGHRAVLAYVEGLEKLIKGLHDLCGKLGENCEAAGRARFDVFEDDEFLHGYICGEGVGWTRTARLLGLVGNVCLVKLKKLEEASAEGES